jgi:hypothetical protein
MRSARARRCDSAEAADRRLKRFAAGAPRLWPMPERSPPSRTAARSSIAARWRTRCGAWADREARRAPRGAAQGGARRRPRRDRAPAGGEALCRQRDRRRLRLPDRPDPAPRLTISSCRLLPAQQPDRVRAAAADGGRRLRPRRDGAPFGRRHRLRHALEADRLDRAGDRGDALSALGPGAEGRPFEPLGRRDDPLAATTTRSAPPSSNRATSGATSLFDEARRRFWKEVVAGNAQRVRHREAGGAQRPPPRMGDSRYVVEPNVKEGKGGLRDLHTLFWIGKYAYRVRSSCRAGRGRAALAASFASSRRPSASCGRCAATSTSSPAAAEERLTFDYQREIAARMNYADRPGKSPVERFMRIISCTRKRSAT